MNRTTLLYVVCVYALFTCTTLAEEVPPGYECTKGDTGLINIVWGHVTQQARDYIMQGKLPQGIDTLSKFATALGAAYVAINPAAGPAVMATVGRITIGNMGLQGVDQLSKGVMNQFIAIQTKYITTQNQYALQVRQLHDWKQLHAQLLPGRAIPDIQIQRPPGGICLGGKQTYVVKPGLDQEIDKLKREASQ